MRTAIESALRAGIGIILMCLMCLRMSHSQPIIELSERSKTVLIQGDSTQVPCELRTTLLDLGLTNGKRQRRHIVSLYEPKHGLFWWTMYTVDPDDSSRDGDAYFSETYLPYISESEILAFVPAGKGVWIRKTPGRFATYGSAKRALMAHLQAQFGRILTGEPLEFTRVDFREALKDEFFLIPGSAAGVMPPFRILSISRSRSNGNWSLRIKGPGGESATVILDREFKLQTVTKETQKDR